MKQRNKPSIDRLSGLPDDVICHILSFLPTTLSVATSALARRWRFVWAHVPNLDFKSHMTRSRLSRVDIINRVVLLYKYRSYDHALHSKFQLEKCITAVMERKVKEIDLSFPNYVVLPSYIFTCKNLIDLRLSYCGYIPTTGDVCLPALKTLHLDSVRYESDKSLVHLLSGCPVLEELLVHYAGTSYCASVSSTTIKRLLLKSDIYSYFYGKLRKVKIDAPALRFLRLEGCVPEEKLSNSSMEMEIIFDVTHLMKDNLYCRSVIEYAGAHCNIKCLKLSNAFLKRPGPSFSDLSLKFHYLTKLELAADWPSLTYFLENADNLEVFIIHKIYDTFPNCWVEPHQVPACLLSHLRTMTIYKFEFIEDEFNKMVRYVLKNACVMKRMEIYPRVHSFRMTPELDAALQRISLYQRGSETCELALL
ncbi:F-box/LRR-repeat protein at4g14096 [Phtheirospermum japonicum]|uniref:F-box/LRR-repeat protein at4g14096 n=1 Tax=Phtheirospermum japonicum TaxID=374723 RepID=A0A830BU53_9LAMI|nr:F-box/LRR-repeat protein at4g14096 [Phtheirospermum japonicum]